MKRSFDIINELIKLLNDNDVGETNYTIIRAYEMPTLPMPVIKVYLSFAPESVKVTYFDDDNGEYCERTEIAIRLNCFVPLNASSVTGNYVTEPVLDFINDRYPDSVKSYSIGDAAYDPKTKAFKQTAVITFRFEQCAAEGSGSDELAVPKNFFCKTHVLDENIHVTGGEKELINNAFEKGEYTGNGSTSQEIVVGFPARYIIVYRKSSHTSSYDSSSGKVVCYTGYAFSGAVTKGLAITSIGFTAKNVSDSSGETRLNENSVKYAYIAYK